MNWRSYISIDHGHYNFCLLIAFLLPINKKYVPLVIATYLLYSIYYSLRKKYFSINASNVFLLIPTVLYFALIATLNGAIDEAAAGKELEIKASMLVFPLLAFMTPKMTRDQVQKIINAFVLGCVVFMFFSIVMYYIAITGYSNPINSSIPFKISLFDKNPILLLNSNNAEEVETVIDIEHETFEEVNSPEINLWKAKIEILIQEEKLYQNPELTLTDLAKKLETNASIISKTINQGFQMNFNDCINNYRVEAVKKMLEQGEHKKSTLLGIAFDCGFNSKATFNRAFKKNTGKTPKEYLLNS